MNRSQLDALLKLGMISLAQHTAALATRDASGSIAERPVITMELPAEEVEEPDASARTITGKITSYGVLIPSHGMILDAGSMTTRLPLDRVKMLRDHNTSDPVGYMTEIDAAVEVATFYIPEGENGDRALQEARYKLRDGLSIGFQFTDYDFDDDWVMTVHAGEIHEVSLCAIPAVTDAGVTNVAAALAANRKENPTMTRAQLAAALAAGTITQAQHDAAIATMDALAVVPPVVPAGVPAELAAGPATVDLTPLSVSDRPKSLRDHALSVVAAAQTGEMRNVQMALAEIGPKDGTDAANVFYGATEQIGEVWSPEGPVNREWIDSFGPVLPLTGNKIEGFKWTDTPMPEKYEGFPAEVPTNKFGTVLVEYDDPDEWAWAARIARIYRDLGTVDLIMALFAKCAKNYNIVSDFDVAQKVLAIATRPRVGGPTSAFVKDSSVLVALKNMARDARQTGVSLDNIKMADNLFDDFADLKIADLPAWLALSLGLSLAEGTTQIGDLTKIKSDSKLADGQIVGLDQRAVDVREKSPINLEALVIPNAGIDIGFHSYGGIYVNDARGVILRTVEPPVDPAA